MTTCIYCECDVTTDETPAPYADSAWAALAGEHARDCEWVATRAHRLYATDAAIEALRREAGAVGDVAQVELCERAEHGEAIARALCARAIVNAASMGGHSLQIPTPPSAEVERLPNGMIRAYGTAVLGCEPTVWRTAAVAARAAAVQRAHGRAVTISRHDVYEYDCARDFDAEDAGA